MDKTMMNKIFLIWLILWAFGIIQLMWQFLLNHPFNPFEYVVGLALFSIGYAITLKE